jgi:hypothetical protein
VNSDTAAPQQTSPNIVHIVACALEKYGQRLLDSGGRELRGFARLFEKTPGVLLAAFTLTYCIGAFGSACHNKLWLDEIIASYIVTLPSLKDIWTALLHAVDGNPPLYYLMARLFLFTGDVPLATRLPAVIGFYLAAVCLFSFLRSMTSTLAAAAATLLFAESGVFRWAVEGRPYGPMLGLTGLALVTWQRSARPGRRRWAWLCGLSLAIACLLSTHYYGAVIVIVLVLAEAVRAAINKRLDWPVYLALALGSAAIVLWFPLIHALRENVGGNAASVNYFAQPGWEHVYAAYDLFISPVIVPLLLCLSVVALGLSRGRDSVGEVQGNSVAGDTAVILGLAFLPVIAHVMAVLATHTFVVRYVVGGALGIAMLFGLLLHRVVARRPAVLVLVLMILYCHWSFGMLPRAFKKDPLYEEALSLLAGTASDTPIVIAEGWHYAPLRYYAAPDLQRRLFYLTDLPTAQRTTDTTNENIMLALKPWAPEQIVDLNTFLGRHSTFLMYYVGFSGNSSLNALLNRGCHVTLTKKRGLDLLLLCDCRE